MPVLSPTGSPASLLASLFSQRASAPSVVLVSGCSGSGKTAWCQARVAEAQRTGLAVAGLLSPAVFASGVKTAIDVLDLGTGERRRLARRALPNETAAVATGAWIFNAAVLAWGNQILVQMVCDAHAPPDLLVLDELGPLEFQHKQGLMEAFPLLRAQRFRLACVTMRPALLSAALDCWPGAHVLPL